MTLRSEEGTGIPTASRAVRRGLLPEMAEMVSDVDGSASWRRPRTPSWRWGKVVPVYRRWFAPGRRRRLSGGRGYRRLECGIRRRNARGKRATARFAVGDPVIWTVNDYDRALWNGSMSSVLEIGHDGGLTVMLDGRELELGSGDLSNLDLAYAISALKAQGSLRHRRAVHSDHHSGDLKGRERRLYYLRDDFIAFATILFYSFTRASTAGRITRR
jgi:exodeoxyribonuclease V alpha subunit